MRDPLPQNRSFRSGSSREVAAETSRPTTERGSFHNSVPRWTATRNQIMFRTS
ncbi:MAG: hypothetical protein HZY73_07600 [Micropruina sp.]|nr:MAG: hypothetical protein HZY73_07600 [Micropruina sp.]